MSAYTVTAHITTPVIEAERHPIMIDSIMAYARSLDGDMPPLTQIEAPDIPLPLNKWETDSDWGWKASKAEFEIEKDTTVNIYRKPAIDAMARYGNFKKHHIGLGPHKARAITLEASIIHTMTWEIDSDAPEKVMELLERVKGIGRGVNTGYGQVAKWDIQPSHQDNGWRNRPFDQHRNRPPYWHPQPTRKENTLC